MMTIKFESNHNEVLLSSLEPGEIILYTGRLFIITNDGGAYLTTCVDIACGDVEDIDRDEKVVLIEAKLEAKVM
jgi:hypothetical protein